MPKNNQPFRGRVSKQNQQSSQKTVLPNNSVEQRHLSQALVNILIPPGMVIDWAGLTAPNAEWIIAEGQLLIIDDFPVLFANVGTQWNTGGEPAGQFRMPNCSGKGRIGAGEDTGNGLSNRVLGQFLGEEDHQLTIPEMPIHTHIQDQHNHTSAAENLTGGGGGSIQAGPEINENSAPISQTVAVNQDTGGDQAHNNMGPSLVFNALIKIDSSF